MDTHAYLAAGIRAQQIWDFLEAEQNFKRLANPDALNVEAETFGIDEARALSDWAYKKSFSERKIAVIQSNSITSEAQNALLKLFEEPPMGTYFFLIVSNVGMILPTLLSRMRVWESGEVPVIKKEARQEFLKSSLGERLKIISKIIKDKNKEGAKVLVRDALAALSLEPVKYKKEIEQLMKAEKFLSGRAPSVKMVLEHMALSV